MAAPLIVPASALGLDDRPAPSNRVTLGVIGCGGKGTDHIRNFLKFDDVQLVAVCDVDREHHRDRLDGKGPVYGRDPAQQMIQKHYSAAAKGSAATCAAFSDYRKLCARKDIDAVIVATPDHWHALCDLEVIRQGKDLYGEKPITHFFREGQQLVREIASYGTIFQTGSQQRSEGNFRRAAELARNGVLGKVTHVEVGLPPGYRTVNGDPSLTTIPQSLDYEFWTGPAELLPYTQSRSHRLWRGHRSYAGGTLMDWIGHHNDIAHWGLGVDNSGPVEVTAVDWTWPETDIYNTPVDFTIRSRYASGTLVTVSSANPIGVKFIGEDGWVFANRGKLAASEPHWITPEFKPGAIELYRSNNHARNFLDCVKSRQPCICPAETGHRSITPGHLGYISQQLQRRLRWDPAAEKFVDDSEAEHLLNIEYRSPWSLKATV
ncbi:MAG: Gfo/Idh/MocA family protein [Planctomycetaceae bacterium]